MCSARVHVRFTPESDLKCDVWNVRKGPKPDEAAAALESLAKVGAMTTRGGDSHSPMAKGAKAKAGVLAEPKK